MLAGSAFAIRLRPRCEQAFPVPLLESCLVPISAPACPLLHPLLRLSSGPPYPFLRAGTYHFLQELLLFTVSCFLALWSSISRDLLIPPRLAAAFIPPTCSSPGLLSAAMSVSEYSQSFHAGASTRNRNLCLFLFPPLSLPLLYFTCFENLDSSCFSCPRPGIPKKRTENPICTEASVSRPR